MTMDERTDNTQLPNPPIERNGHGMHLYHPLNALFYPLPNFHFSLLFTPTICKLR